MKQPYRKDRTRGGNGMAARQSAAVAVDEVGVQTRALYAGQSLHGECFHDFDMGQFSGIELMTV